MVKKKYFKMATMAIITTCLVSGVYGVGVNKIVGNPTEVFAATGISKTYTSSRLGGDNRFQTAFKIADTISTEKVDAVVLANAFNFPDALSGSTLAVQKNAPILLASMKNADNTQVISYIKNKLNKLGTIYLLGGTSVIPDSIITSLKAQGYTNFKRLGGANRFETNLKIVSDLNIPKGTDIIVANSKSFADSLSSSGIAGTKGMPIFLVDGALRSDILAKIKSISPKNIYIAGGTVAVSSSIENSLKGVGKVVRLGGKDRYETSLKIAKYFNQDTTTAVIANGLNFPDALTGSVLAAKNNSPVVLVGRDVSKQRGYLDSTKINKVYVMGGTSAISDSILSKLVESSKYDEAITNKVRTMIYPKAANYIGNFPYINDFFVVADNYINGSVNKSSTINALNKFSWNGIKEILMRPSVGTITGVPEKAFNSFEGLFPYFENAGGSEIVACNVIKINVYREGNGTYTIKFVGARGATIGYRN